MFMSISDMSSQIHQPTSKKNGLVKPDIYELSKNVSVLNFRNIRIIHSTFTRSSLLILDMGHLSALANSDDEKDSMISDLEHRDDGKPTTESEPTTGRSKERVS